MIEVKGKWALVTGASRGIGFQIASFLAKQGCNLILQSRKLEHTKGIKSELQSFGVEVHCVEAELSNNDSIDKMLDKIESFNVEVDIVFNNAAIQVTYLTDYWKTPIEDFEKSFQVNFIAVTSICYRLIPKMIERGFGRVINVSSGIMNQPEQAAYSASKAALDKFTKDLGSKLEGSDVIISLADPGWCKTDLGGSMAPNSPESSIPGIVLGAFVNDKKSGRFISAQDYTGLSLEEAANKLQSIE